MKVLDPGCEIYKVTSLSGHLDGNQNYPFQILGGLKLKNINRIIIGQFKL